MKATSRSSKGLRSSRVCLSQLVISLVFIRALVGGAKPEQSAFEHREAAYRANNIGVAMLEQYKPRDAAESFQHALTIDPGLRLAQINLSIALYYVPDNENAKRAAEKALAQDPRAPQPHYILGLIARIDNRFDDAIKEFQSVLAVDNEDVATNVNIGQIYVQEKKNQEAAAAFRKALAAEPYNETALYNLGIVLTRTGAKEEGQRVLQKFKQFSQSGAGTRIGTNYLEGGHYAEAIVSTGAEAELVDRKIPAVKFIDVTETLLPRLARISGPAFRGATPSKPATNDLNAREQPIVLFDYDGDGDLDIFDAAVPPRLLRNDGGKFTDVTAGSGLSVSESQYCFAAVAGDYDNDGRTDLFVAYGAENKFVLYHNDGNGHFSDRTKQAGIMAPPRAGAPYVSAAFADVDHDGDLDIVVTGPSNILFRNNGNGTFADITQAAAVNAHDSPVTGAAVVPTDFDNRRDVDLFVLNRQHSPMLFRNMRDGTFRNVAKETGLDNGEGFWCVAAGDVNKDGFTDFFMSSGVRAAFAVSDGRGRFKLSSAPAAAKGALAAQFLDYDNDGLLDLLAVTTRGLRIWRNVGNEFVDVSARALPALFRNVSVVSGLREPSVGKAAIASGDVDNDGDIDVILRVPDGGLCILRNEGGN